MRNKAYELLLSGLVGFSLLYVPGAEGSLSFTVVNNTGDPGYTAVCMQGYAAGSGNSPPPPAPPITPTTPPSPYLFVTPMTPPVSGNAQFNTTVPGYTVAGPMPTFIVPTTLNILTSSNSQDVSGGRLYFWLSKTGCTNASESLLTYNPATSNSPAYVSVSNDVTDSISSPFVIVELTDLQANGSTVPNPKVTIDLTQIDSFTIPVNLSVNQGNSVPPIGGSNASATSPQSLQGIDNQWNTFTTTSASAYAGLSTTNTNYPTGYGPILSPADFLGLTIPGTRATPVIRPNAADHLNFVYDTTLNTLFKSTIHINKTGLPGAAYVGVPTANIAIKGAPSLLSGLAFCFNTSNTTAPTACTNPQFAVLNPVGLTVTTNPSTGHMLMGTVDGTNLTEVMFTETLPAHTLEIGEFMIGVVGNWSGPSNNYYITACLPNGCSSALGINGIMVSMAHDTALQIGTPYQFIFSRIPNATTGAEYHTSGDQVFGNWGVFTALNNATINGATVTGNADIGNVLSSALNRGVAGTVCTSNCIADSDSSFWNTETNWYPAPSTTVSNEYARFFHTELIGSTNIFTLPSGPVKSAGQPTGTFIAMAYGFPYDENPMDNNGCGPTVVARPCPPAPNVPAEMNFNPTPPGNVLTLTFGPLATASPGGNPGVCGTANNQNYTTPPSSGLCSSGAATTVTTSENRWVWQCLGTNGSHTNVNCSAGKSPTPPPTPTLGCGTANSGTYSSAPTQNLCLPDNVASLVHKVGVFWKWSCTVAGVGTDPCQASLASINVVVKTPYLKVGRGEFLSFSGDAGRGVVTYSVTSGGSAICSITTQLNQQFLKTKGGAGYCNVTARIAGDANNDPTISPIKTIYVH